MKIKGIYVLIVTFFVLYVLLWFLINYTKLLPDSAPDYYTDSYGFIALLGSLIGIRVSKQWGGYTSYFGLAVLMLSLGLCMQFLGQASYAIYHYVFHVENPYPSFGEIFYFGSIPVYIFGIFKLARAVGASRGLTSWANKLALLLVPVGLFGFVYVTFLKGYEIYDPSKIVIFLDFGYPIGQGIYVAVAVLTLLFARINLGGKMRMPVFVLLGAFIVQYVADLVYSIRTVNETWAPGGLSDLLYLTAYFFMGVALYLIGTATNKLNNS